MKIISFSSPRVSHTGKLRGFSLLEILIVIAAMSSVFAMAFVYLSNAVPNSKEAKLKHDVTVLNNAIRTYVMSGGSMDEATTSEQAIDKLKTTAKASPRGDMAGLKGAMIDLRLRGKTTSGPGLRAFYDKNSKMFKLQQSDTGISEFVLDPAAVPTVQTEDDRRILMAMNSQDKWIWSFGDQLTSNEGPDQNYPDVTDAPMLSPGSGSTMTVLQAPDFSIAPGLLPFAQFDPDVKVELTGLGRNPDNSAQAYYSIGGGEWIRWTGAPISIPRALMTEVRTYSASLDPDKYEQSAVRDAVYETLYFAGTNSGVFGDPYANPATDPNSYTEPKAPIAVKNRTDSFKWGTKASTSDQSNLIKFVPKTIGIVPPEQEFDLGTLTYTNGTTQAGSNASTVTLFVTVNLTVPEKVSDTVAFKLDLKSTPNNKANPFKGNATQEKAADDADADYVEFKNSTSKLQAKFKGQTYYLALSFQNNDINGYTTPDTFHTHEGKTMSGIVRGKFTIKPQLL